MSNIIKPKTVDFKTHVTKTGKKTPDFYKGTSLRWCREWEPGRSYVNDDYHIDLVYHKGKSWICTESHISNAENAPSEDVSVWELAVNQSGSGIHIGAEPPTEEQYGSLYTEMLWLDTSVEEDSFKVYSASEVDLKLDTLDSKYRNRWTELSNAKANKATTLAGYGITDAYTKTDVNLIKSNLEESNSRLDKRITAIENGGTNVSNCISITYSKLKSLRDNKTLVPGVFYRITDYECTTVQADSRSANHPFDIIVQALDESTLSENARAIQHDGDEYFTDAKLEAWHLKYTIDNDTSRFAWAKDEIKESVGSWDSDAGHIKTVTSKEDDILPEKTIAINDVETPVFCPTNINNYDFSTFDIGRPGRTYSYDEFKRFKYLGNEKPYSNTITTGGDYGYGESSKTYYDWSNVEKIWVYLDNELVTTMNSRGNGYFADPKGANWAQFIPEPEYIDEQYYCYEPTYSSEWHVLWEGNSGRWDYNWISDFNPQDSIYCIYLDDSKVYRLYSETEKKVYLDRNGESLINIYHTPYVEYRPSGKGVIYRMIDEHNNNYPFDFKNMQFLNNEEWYYAFSFKGKDISITDYCYNNYLSDNKANSFDDTTTPVAVQLPMLILDARPNANGRTSGISNCHFVASVKKGYVSATRIENFEWKPRIDGDFGMIENIYINISVLLYGNSISGCCKEFVVGTKDAPASAFYDNEIHLATYQSNNFTCNASTFVNNKLDLTESSAGFVITAGSMTSCNITNTFYERGKDTDKIDFGANAIMRDCVIKMYNALTINYANTTSTTEPLRFLNIDARGLNDSTITIPTTFPKNASYELKVAKNSKGEIKMWCDADLAN